MQKSNVQPAYAEGFGVAGAHSSRRSESEGGTLNVQRPIQSAASNLTPAHAHAHSRNGRGVIAEDREEYWIARTAEDPEKYGSASSLHLSNTPS